MDGFRYGLYLLLLLQFCGSAHHLSVWFDAVVKFEGQVVSMPFWQRIRVANAVRKLKKQKTRQRVKYLQERLTKALQPKETEK